MIIYRRRGSRREGVYRWLFTIVAFSSLAALVGIMATLFAEGIPVFREVSLRDFMLGRFWYPTHEEAEYGILPLVLGSLWVTAGALVICVPLGLGSALYLNELAGNRTRSILKPTIEVLAAIPSVVFGFFGMVLVGPLVQRALNLPTGLTALTGSIVLGIMATPTVCSISEDALSFVPRSFREASLALGGNRWQTLTRVVVPAAGSGLCTAVMLGMSRAIGETMTVLMVTGGAAVIPTSYLQPVRPMTSTIAAEMGEAAFRSVHYHALFAIALALFFITLSVNVIAEIVGRRFRMRLGGSL